MTSLANKIICIPCQDSDHPGDLPSRIRVFAVCSMGSYENIVSSGRYSPGGYSDIFIHT